MSGLWMSLAVALALGAEAKAEAEARVQTAVELDGLDVVVVTRPNSRCSARLVVRAGADKAPPGKHGLAHLVEHLPFRGEAGFATLMSPRASVNAFTTVGNTVFTLESTPEHCEAELTRLLSTVTTGKLPRPWVQKELEVIRREAVYSSDVLDVALFGGTRPQVIGTATTRDAIRYEDVVRFYQGQYTPENMALVVVGPLDLTTVRRSLEQGFKLAPSLPNQRRSRDPVPFKPRGESKHTGLRAGSVLLATALPFEKIALCRNLAALFELRLARQLLPGTGSIATRCQPVQGQLMLAVVLTTEPGDQERGRDLALREWVEIKPARSAEAKLVRQHLRNQALDFEGTAGELADALAATASWRRGEALFSLVPAWLSANTVTPDELAEAKAFTELSHSTVVLGDLFEEARRAKQ